jgi:hypothetical protein
MIFDPVGLSDLYARFFADPAQLALMSRRFAGLGMTQSIALEVSWDEPMKVGTITVFVPEQDRRGEALLPSLESEGAVPVDQLSILLQPVARYRAALAERFDLRILSFHLRLGFWDRSTGSYCSIRGDTNDPNGDRFGACFRCLEPRAGVVELCRSAPAWPAPITGDVRGLRMLRSALKSQPAGG